MHVCYAGKKVVTATTRSIGPFQVKSTQNHHWFKWNLYSSYNVHCIYTYITSQKKVKCIHVHVHCTCTYGPVQLWYTSGSLQIRYWYAWDSLCSGSAVHWGLVQYCVGHVNMHGYVRTQLLCTCLLVKMWKLAPAMHKRTRMLPCVLLRNVPSFDRLTQFSWSPHVKKSDRTWSVIYTVPNCKHSTTLHTY
jgi:hypothetical protein